MGILLLKKFFDLMTGKGRNNSISCLDISISCFWKPVWNRWDKWGYFCQKSFLMWWLERGEIIPFPVWIIPFPVMKTILESLKQMGILLLKKFFDPMTGKGKNNSLSCLDNSISIFWKPFRNHWTKWGYLCQRSFLIRWLERGKIIPFPV